MPVCQFCYQQVAAVDQDGSCAACGDWGDYEPSSTPISDTYGDDEACPRCGASVSRLVGVTGRGGTRYVCESCRADALASDRSFWHWYWKE